MHKTILEYGGKTVQGKILSQPIIIFIVDPVNVKYVLADNFDNYVKVCSLHISSTKCMPLNELVCAIYSRLMDVLSHVLPTQGALFSDRVTDLLGDGIFNVDGQKWYSQRKIASHIFKLNELQGFMTK